MEEGSKRAKTRKQSEIGMKLRKNRWRGGRVRGKEGKREGGRVRGKEGKREGGITSKQYKK